MKKIIILLAILFATITTYGQEYNQWAVDGEIGSHVISDESTTLDSYQLHFGAGVRYNLNEKFGVGLRVGYDNLDLLGYNSNIEGELDFYRLNLEGTVDVLGALDLRNKHVAILLHGGPGVSYFQYDDRIFQDESESYEFLKDKLAFNLAGGLTGLVKINKQLALKLDWSAIANISHGLTLDGYDNTTSAGVTSMVHNFSIGAVVYFGEKDKDGNRKEHADWWIKPAPVYTIINNITNPVTHTTTTIIEKQDCDCIAPVGSEYVFFKHDKYIIRETELNAIYRTFVELVKNEDSKLVIKGFASPTSSSDDYNLILSQNRSLALQNKFLDMGISDDRISIESYGKDFKFDVKNAHDIARRVELIVVQ